ncbi:DUF4239 domain-containing protein [Parapusillimonas sp. SGNA-6]|nr:DUF4239 domain-containing protein [Parapusillimonas sp. SGNA-6]
MNFYEQIFHLSDVWLFFFSIGSVALLGVFAIAVMVVTHRILPNTRGTTMVNTMLSGILLPTGMVIAFVAADVWQNDEKGRVAVEQEATAVSDAIRVTKHLAPEPAAKIKKLIQDYVESAMADEWPRMAQSLYSDETELALEDLMVAAVRLEAHAADFAESIAGQELRKYTTRIELARDSRLRVSETRIRTPKWVAVWILLFVSACVLAELHLHHRRALLIAMSLFSLGFGVTIFLISAYDRPFTGRTIIEPLALQNALVRAYR